MRPSKNQVEKILAAVGSEADPEAVRYAMDNEISLNEATFALMKPIVLEGELIRDRLGWSEFVRIGPTFVKHWIWDVLARMPSDRKVRITIELVKEEPHDAGLGPYT